MIDADLSITNEVNTNYLAKDDTEDSKSLNYDELSDNELIRLFIETQDKEAFEEIVNRYSDNIYGIALRITTNPTDAEEVLQEVFLILLEKLDTFRQESKFSTWLYRVAANTSYKQIRKRNKKRDNEFSIDDYKPYNDSGVLTGVQEKDWSDMPDDVLLSQEGMELIEKAINELSPKYRVVFHMKDVEGLTSREIGEILDLSIPAVKSRVLRSRLFLRDKLSDYFYEWAN